MPLLTEQWKRLQISNETGVEPPEGESLTIPCYVDNMVNDEPCGNVMLGNWTPEDLQIKRGVQENSTTSES